MFRLLFLLFPFTIFAQSIYNSPQNPMYWKNKPPHAAYWQQDVAYKIDAEIDETTDMISGYEQLTYTNNSPDTVKFVFFHLYQNAFLPGSYLDQLQRANGTKPTFGKYESSQRGIAIESISIAKIELRKELDNTILKGLFRQASFAK